MLFLAVSTMDKLSKVPASFWLKVALGIIGFVIGIMLLRKLFEVNKVILFAVGGVTLCIFWFQWIYERNEPAFLTPIIDPIARFFPSKGSYEVTQQSEPGKPSLKKPAAPAAAPKR